MHGGTNPGAPDVAPVPVRLEPDAPQPALGVLAAVEVDGAV